MGMTSRERVRAALNHKEPDRMPIDFGAMRSTGMEAVAYNNLKKYFGMPTETTKIYDIWQQLAEPEMELINRFHGDVIQLHRLKPCYSIKIDEYKPGEDCGGNPCLVAKDFNPVTDPDGKKYILDSTGRKIGCCPVGGHYYDRCYRPCEDAETEEDIDKAIEGHPDFLVIDDEEAEWLHNQAKAMYENTDKAILGEFVGSAFYEQGQYDFGYATYYEYLLTEPELINYYNSRRLELLKSNVKKYLDAVGDYIDLIHMGDDLGTQESGQISLGTYREMIKPYVKELWAYIKELRPDIKIFYHCCGSIAMYIPDLIDAGIDVLNPVQLTAKGMDAKELKEKFGDKITFWGGGCNMTTTAENGTVEDIQNEVRELTKIWKPGGGYVFNQVHNIQDGISPEKVIAIYDTAYECSAYN